MKDVLCPSTEKFDCIATCKTCPIGSDNNVTSCNHTTDMTIRCGKLSTNAIEILKHYYYYYTLQFMTKVMELLYSMNLIHVDI